MAALLTKTLGVVCPSCDFLNVIGAVRCMACGSATDAVAQSAPVVSGASSIQSAAFQSTPSSVAAAAAAASAPSPGVAPPNLRRTSPTVPTPPPPAAAASAPTASSPSPEPLGQPPAPSDVFKGPARPTFQSSQAAAAPVASSPGTAAVAAGASAPKFGLTVLAGPARGQRFRLGANGAQVGRSKGVILFPDDPFVSPLHAMLLSRDGKLFVRDESSTSGVYVSIAGQETIPAGGSFCTGLRLFRYVGAIEPTPPWNRVDVQVYGAPLPNGQVHYAIEEVLLGDRPGRCIATPGPVLTIGQGKCDFAFTNDEGLAPRHCEVAPMPMGAMVRDLSGGLGTYVRISGERALKAGDRLRIGQQTLQIEALS